MKRRISFDDFIKYDESLFEENHVWEVLMPFGPVGELRFRTAKFTPGECENTEARREAVFDLIRGCRFSETDYYVFCDDRLVMGL